MSKSKDKFPDPIVSGAAPGLDGRWQQLQREYRALQAVGTAVASGRDLQHTLEVIAREIAVLLAMKACAIWRWSEESRTICQMTSHGPEGWWQHNARSDCYLPTDLASTQELLRQQRAQLITASQPDLVPAERAHLAEAGYCTVLKVPMIFGVRVMGLVEVIDDEAERDFAAGELALVQLLANQAATAIENDRLYDAIRRHVAEVTTLNRISQVITSILELHETLAIIADHARWLLRVAAASVILYDRESGDLWFGASSGQGSDFIRGKRLARGQGIVDWVIEHGQPLVVADAAQDERFFPDWDQEMAFTTRSILCVPLQTKGRTTGAIEAINKEDGPFDEEDLSLLTTMAASAAIAIENARLYEQAQQEIAERKRMERELQRYASELEARVAERTRELADERDRTQAILEAVGEAVIVTDLDGQIRYLNPAAVELTGYTRQEAEKRRFDLLEYGLPDRAPDAGELQTRRAEVVSRRKDGSLYDAAMTVAPLFDSQAADRPIGYVCVQRDISPIKEAERLKDEFVSNVSHELRTPLSIITLISGNLDRLYGRLDDARRAKMVRDIRTQAEVLNNLVTGILEISRIESGRVSMDRERLDLAHLLREEVEKQVPLARKKAQTLAVAAAEDLPVWGNEGQLRQVIRNLVNNAIKYTPRQGQIRCDCRPIEAGRPAADWPGSSELARGHWAAVRVVDTGIGISADDLPRIYERFYRVESQGNVPGTGLGLPITKELVELHGGRIAVTSAPGEGSTFATYLPLWEE